jgi:beta-glucosidase-like glycosyl hydrolase
MNGDLLRMLAPHMIVGLEGPRLSAEEKRLLAEYPFSGIILFERNAAEARRLMELTREVKGIYRETRGTVPIIAADHEGGAISALGRAIGVPPTQMAVSRAGDLCDRLFAENARRMRACGVNMLLGPVADVNSERLNPVIGTRSFGEETGLVSPLVRAAVSAARRGGVLTCIKHFPGHGPSSVDSHLALPVLDATLEQLEENDIPPFASGIAAGAEAVMVGHVAPRGRSLPASLDAGIIEELLRGKLGFGGVVLTDALEMEGVKVAGFADICVRALGAGNDILLFSKGVSGVIRDLEALEGSFPGDELGRGGSGASRQASLARIGKLVDAAAGRERDFELPGDSSVYGEIADRSIRVERNRAGANALSTARGLRLAFYAEKGEFERFPAMSFIAHVLKGLNQRGVNGVRSGAPDDAGLPSPERLDTACRSAANLEGRLFSFSGGGGDAIDVVFLLNRRPLSVEAAEELCSGTPAVVVAGWPYTADFILQGKTIIVTYGIYDAAADAAARALANP